MDFQTALEYLRASTMMTRRSWANGEKIKLEVYPLDEHKRTFITGYRSCAKSYQISSDDFNEEWQLCLSGKILTFPEAMKALQSGYFVKIKSWPIDDYLFIDGNNRHSITMHTIEEFLTSITYEDTLANDWEVSKNP